MNAVCSTRDGRSPRARDDAGVGMLGLITSLVIIGLLAVVVMKSLDGVTKSANIDVTVSSLGGDSPPGASGVGGLIAQSGDLVAQQNLMAALAIVDQVAITAGGYGSVTSAQLTAQGGDGTFTSGPSTRASLISVLAAGGADGGVTLAVRSASGACWLAWRSNAATVFGKETGRSLCVATAHATAPSRVTVGKGAADWQTAKFPPT